jgi:3',5'-cyclic AMP phosphodiesterase CpdA
VSRWPGRPAVEVFALEPRAAQLVVRAADDHPRVVTVDGRDGVVETAGGVGAVVIDGLEPDTSYEARLDGRPAATLRTLAEPPGAYLGRFATVSDLHLGETGFGHLPRLHLSRNAATAHPVVCLHAALAELQLWGAEGLVVKGDVSHDSRRHEYELVAAELRDLPMPLWVIPGNHDGGNHRHDDGGRLLAAHGITLHDRTTELKLGGLRVILVNTVRPGHEHGYPPADDDPLFDLLAHRAPTMIVLHHQLMSSRIPYYLPPGVPSAAARRLLDRIDRANPATLVTSGHTHRHRRRQHGRVVVTEVGSTKDHPGIWGGYLVYEGGVVQTVRRIMDPAALAWTERAASSALGVWGRWSPGRLSDRSFTHAWPSP